MAHANWCGEPCCDCERPCGLDQSIPCSPDCTELLADGNPSYTTTCLKCDAHMDDAKVVIENDGEIAAQIRDYLADENLSWEEVISFFQDWCSVWDDKETLDKFLEGANQSANEFNEIPDGDECRQLKDGRWLLIAF